MFKKLPLKQIKQIFEGESPTLIIWGIDIENSPAIHPTVALYS